MNNQIKTLHVCFPETGEARDMSFPEDDFKAIIAAYRYLIESDGVVTSFDGFKHWEIKLLQDSKAPSGEPLVNPGCCGKNEPGDGRC